jgi:DNA-binding MarR family transcriptional regulator/GNAT superfamily N-acetyltransferase
MASAAVEQVRCFNRTVTQRIGALQENYLARSRPLGASRLLWEIAPSGTDLKSLRARLGLDSGYLSRLLRGLESERLVRVDPGRDDARVRVARLTAAGRRERAELDRLSDDLAGSLLAPLTPGQRETLVDAMATVQRLLTAGLVEIAVADPRLPDAQACLTAYVQELETRFETGFDPAASISATADELTEPAGVLLLARLRGEPVGCGALKFRSEPVAEVKRMWVDARVRGLGVGRRLLAELERLADGRGVRTLRLETNRALAEAIGMYRTAGYREVAAFNHEPYAHHWFEKDLRPR